MFTPKAQMTVAPIHRGSSLTLVLPNRLDVHTVDELVLRVEDIVRSGAIWLSINAAEVRHIDRAGLDFIRHFSRELDASTVSYTVGSMSLTMRIAMELNGLDAELAQLDSHSAHRTAA